MENPKFLFAVILLVIVGTTPFSHVTASTLTITISTDKPSYIIAENITVHGNLTYNGSPVQNWPVALEVQDPNHTPVVTRTPQTDNNGKYNITFKLSTNAKLGTYTVYVSSSYKGETASGNTAFELTAPVKNINTHLGYMTIQAAINAPQTLNGHTIFVGAGTYYEHVTISKSLTLIGENEGTTIIDGDGTGYVVYVTADNTMINSFTIQNGAAGIRIMSGYTHNMICRNIIANCDFGIASADHFNNTIDSNIITNTSTCIWLGGSSNSTITKNVFIGNTRGINIHLSSYTTISDNNLTHNSEIAILVPAAYNNTIIRNNIEYNQWGILIKEGSTYNTLIDNNITNSNFAGIGISYSFNNTIYHNNIINNAHQTWNNNSTDNVWDNGYPSGGNYWSDYAGIDLYSGPYQNETGSDGIGDAPYTIDENNQDNYPLTKPYPWSPHDIGITSVTTSKSVVGQGFNLHIAILIFNYGNEIETFNVTAFADTEAIATFREITLTSGNSKTITFTWNTTGFAKGNYTISAYAWPVTGESDTADNTKIGGTVVVTVAGDVTGEGLCDMQDISILVDKFLAEPGDPRWNPNCDVQDDLVIDMADISIAIDHFLQDP